MESLGRCIDVFANKYNLITGGIIAVLSANLGEYGHLFLAFLVLNVADYSTGWIKARINKVSSSAIGAKGIAKKVGYWVVIGISFWISVISIDFGKDVGMDLSFLTLVGFFTLATYIINELRSIVENLVEMGVYMPPHIKMVIDILAKGLKVAEKAIEQKHGNDNDKKVK